MRLSALDVAVCGVALSLCLLLYKRRSRGNPANLPHPPGPRGLPFIGNLFDIPKAPEWITYLRWSEKYSSDLVRLNVFGNNIIVLNSVEAITDLLEKRSSNYSDRPEMVMLNELCGVGWGVAFLRYGNFWRDCRRAFQQNFHLDGVKHFRPQEEAETHRFLSNLLRTPEDLMLHLRHMAGAEIIKLAYGIDVQPENDPFIEAAEHVVNAITVTTNPGSYLVDILPFLKHVPEWLPGAGFQKEARIWKQWSAKLLHIPYGVVQKRIEQGDAPDCVATSLLGDFLQNAKDREHTESVIRSTLASMYVAGADTTVSGLGSFFLAMVLYPDIQVKAQREIDEHCHGRLPTFSDYSALQYIHAIVKEALRWNPVIPLAVPHRSSADDFYKGFYIPKNSLLVGNTWAILHDEKVYPDPLTFNPSRFLKDGIINTEVPDPASAAFGYGRRVCPGRFMAYESTWIAIASTLAVFSISKAKNNIGEPITPSGDYDLGFLCYPKAFPCDISPRSPEHKALLETAIATQAV